MSRKKTQINEKANTHPFLWKHLTQDDLSKMDSMTPELIEKHICAIMNLNDYKSDLIQGSLVDFYFSNYWWAQREQQFNHEQISIFFSISQKLIENLIDKKASVTENIADFHNLLAQVNQNSAFFSNTQVVDMTEFIFITLFQHYKLFEFMVNEKQEEYVIFKEIDVECPLPSELPFPPPLDEALPENLYRKYILKINDETPVELKETEAKEEQVEITEVVGDKIKTMFESLSLEDAKRVIYEVTNEMIGDMKIDMRKTIKSRESVLLQEVSQLSTKVSKP